jgi:hypothetical protein
MFELIVHNVHMRWQFPIEMSASEQELCCRLGVRSRFYCFLRRVRHLLFDGEFQALLASMYEDKARGLKPVAPALLAMVILLQAYTRASDAEAIECVKADLRWQLVLGCLDVQAPCFCQKTLAFFRLRLIGTGMDEELLARTVQLARDSKLFDPKKVGKLRIAIDSAPLEGAGRVEDTINLIGHATRILVRELAHALKLQQSEIAHDVGLTIITTASVKACLDIDWNDQHAQTQALRKLVSEAERLRAWIEAQVPTVIEDEDVKAALGTLRRVIDQDTEPDPDGSGLRIKQGVAADRQISLSDPDMRHGRKSSSQRIDGYKRYDVDDLDSKITLSTCVLPANVPEHEGADKMSGEIEEYGEVVELHADRAFLPSDLTIKVHSSGGSVVAKPYNSPNNGLFPKQDFQVDLKANIVRCPQDKTAPVVGDKAQFHHATCSACPSRSQCQKPSARAGRTISIHPQEQLMQQLHQQVKTPQGRLRVRERVHIEHKLAHHCNRQGPRARYRGTRKNDFDARRIAAVTNLQVIAAGSNNGETLEERIAA